MAYMCVRHSGKECDCCHECRGGEQEEEKVLECPVCGSSTCDYLYKQDGSVIGCDDCIDRVDIWEA